jgi:hypothetical protein
VEPRKEEEEEEGKAYGFLLLGLVNTTEATIFMLLFQADKSRTYNRHTVIK